jgi:hypothetical protein
MRKVVLVCGGRDYADRRTVYNTLDAEHDGQPISLLLAGGANGADALAVDWARFAGVKFEVFNADWEALGRAAGPRRNQQMLDEGNPDLVLAFPGGRGTADMVRRAKTAGVEVVNVGA